ncbi:hypothetical protein CEXT_597771 [Caerostris extrusa]|uniref:Uncharacterized protein n=1 Tax=Caerostris extrusa TaxID=172846 RepID=A0AAV4NPB7_CAEEX|nr:hypothetical protein CEXT_597771 [Caerostris extrusa]
MKASKLSVQIVSFSDLRDPIIPISAYRQPSRYIHPHFRKPVSTDGAFHPLPISNSLHEALRQIGNLSPYLASPALRSGNPNPLPGAGDHQGPRAGPEEGPKSCGICELQHRRQHGGGGGFGVCAKKISGVNRGVERPKDSDRGLRAGLKKSTKNTNSSSSSTSNNNINNNNGLRVTLVEEM